MRQAWVIGGVSGIGRATADLLQTFGRNVLVSGINVDVREEKELTEGFEAWVAGTDPEDKFELVYSAGVNKLSYISGIDQTDVSDIFDVNVFGFIRCLQIMRDLGLRNVHVVAISSDAAVRPMRTSLAYCSSKAALNMAVQCAARELAVHGWRVNAVAPGMIDGTPMTEYIDDTVPALRGWDPDDAREYENSQLVIKRRGGVDEVASAVRFLLDGPDYINGHILTVNGGR